MSIIKRCYYFLFTDFNHSLITLILNIIIVKSIFCLLRRKYFTSFMVINNSRFYKEITSINTSLGHFNDSFWQILKKE